MFVMRGVNHPGRCISVALIATLLLRASIPDGFMPAPAGSGLLYELCPVGLPAGMMEMLSGADPHHHHDSTDTSHYDASQCPIGHLLASAAAIDAQYLDPDLPVGAEVPFTGTLVLASTRRLTARPRGPPA